MQELCGLVLVEQVIQLCGKPDDFVDACCGVAHECLSIMMHAHVDEYGSQALTLTLKSFTLKPQPREFNTRIALFETREGVRMPVLTPLHLPLNAVPIHNSCIQSLVVIIPTIFVLTKRKVYCI